jgi:low affinity Fe/Cu permease
MRLVRRIVVRAPSIVGSPGSFVAAILLSLAWVVAGVFVHWSDSWLLWPSAIASVVTFLIVFSLQYTQNRDTRAIHLKLDEILRATGRAETGLVQLERSSDEEIARVEREILESSDDAPENRGPSRRPAG